MPPRDFEAVSYIVEPPEFEYRDGHFHIRQRFSESCVIERVMAPHVFMLSLRRAAEAAREHRLGGAVIIPFERPEDTGEETAAAH
jgi:hypothetical protein